MAADAVAAVGATRRCRTWRPAIIGTRKRPRGCLPARRPVSTLEFLGHGSEGERPQPADWITALGVVAGGLLWLARWHVHRRDREGRLYSAVRALLLLSRQAKKNRDMMLKRIAKLRNLPPVYEDARERMETMLREGAFTVPGTSSELQERKNGVVVTVEKHGPAWHIRTADGAAACCGSEEHAWRSLGEDIREELMRFLDENSLRADLK